VTQTIPNPELARYFDRIAHDAGVPPYHHHFKAHSIHVNGFDIHLDIFEYDKSAPTVIFCPGTSVYALCYAELLFKLGAAGYNIVGLDPRGHGQSSGTRGDYTIAEIMEDVRAVKAFVKEEFNERVSLMGSSQGGIVSLYMAAADNDIDAIICQNFADLTHPETKSIANVKGIFNYFRPIVKQFANSFENVQVPVSLYLDLQSVQLKHFGNVKHFLDQDPLALKTVSLRAIKSLMTTSLAKPLSEITTPVMVFQGTEDTIFPMRYTQRLYDELTCKKRMKLFPGMNHACMIDDADEILPHLSAWLFEIYEEKG
jgi:pimeloyl-ACP methyl ester carboxylesterase